MSVRVPGLQPKEGSYVVSGGAGRSKDALHACAGGGGGG